ncbi:hypothetical protein [Flavimarina sp. Hel_I_48]|nr:hypothetical protein [Flavimarina sp. Hel_I_48]
MHTISSITEFILELEKNGDLDLKISKDKLSTLVNKRFTEQEIYNENKS